MGRVAKRYEPIHYASTCAAKNTNAREDGSFDCRGRAVHEHDGVMLCDTHYRLAMVAAESVRKTQVAAMAWLHDRGMRQDGKSKGEFMRDLARYRQKLISSPKPGYRDWALTIATRIADGEQLPMICEQNAMDAMAKT